MSLSISSRIPSFRAPETVAPFKPTFAAATPEVTDPSASSKPVSLFQNDSFGAVPAPGTEIVPTEDKTQMSKDLLKIFENIAQELVDLAGESAPKLPDAPATPAAPETPKSLKDAGEVKEGEAREPNRLESVVARPPVEGPAAEEVKAA